MGLFRRENVLQQLEAPLAELAALANKLAPQFLNGFSLSADKLMADHPPRKRDMPYAPQPFTDKAAFEHYGMNREQLSMVILKTYLIFCILGYLRGKRRLRIKDLFRIRGRLYEHLLANCPQTLLEQEWKKVIVFQNDKPRQAAFLLDHVLYRMGVLDDSFEVEDRGRIYEELLPLMEFMSLCLMVRIDRLLFPQSYAQQLELYRGYKGSLAGFKINLAEIDTIVAGP
jgi:hypothetical protein